MKRIAAIDYGTARIGISLSDTGQVLASSLETIKAKPSVKENAEAIVAALSPHAPLEAIVLGLPLLMNGKESPLSTIVRELAFYIEELCHIPIIFWDERLTTAQVERTLKEGQMRRKERSRHVDALAARLILQSYLDHLELTNLNPL